MDAFWSKLFFRVQFIDAYRRESPPRCPALGLLDTAAIDLPAFAPRLAGVSASLQTRTEVVDSRKAHSVGGVSGNGHEGAPLSVGVECDLRGDDDLHLHAALMIELWSAGQRIASDTIRARLPPGRHRLGLTLTTPDDLTQAVYPIAVVAAANGTLLILRRMVRFEARPPAA